ncbi:unnamed protein product [Prorocentrum cordatum]|uniref:Uncharacterized protein n=1 Tax=Prorocentrum cordatum TaxID=2364126 RepID=A0ABN9RN77_9DINO|nr:unnamed protein product [Polarella glacialis]
MLCLGCSGRHGGRGGEGQDTDTASQVPALLDAPEIRRAPPSVIALLCGRAPTAAVVQTRAAKLSGRTCGAIARDASHGRSTREGLPALHALWPRRSGTRKEE